MKHLIPGITIFLSGSVVLGFDQCGPFKALTGKCN